MQPYELAQKWGWTVPTESVLAIAQHCVQAASLKTGELLVELGIVDQARCDRLLKSKPDTIRTLTWFSQNESVVAPHMDRIYALQAGYPFYAKLEDMSIHECMFDTEVKARADSIDAAVMTIQDTVPVLVFATFAALLNFKSMGRAEAAADPIVKHLAGTPRLAVGSRDEISVIIRSVLASTDTSTTAELANLWVAVSVENREKPANRLVTRLIDHALNTGATDIALMPQRNGDYRVQIRKYNEMIDAKTIGNRISGELAVSVVQLLQTKSGANPTNTEQRLPSNGHISYKSSASGDVFLRLSFIPLNHLGELRNLTSVSIRLLPRTEANISVHKLELDPVVIEVLRFSMQLGHGLVMVVGPTNSGKSTTVAGAIGEHVSLFGERRKRLSVEDPIERFLPGITQVNIPTHVPREEAFAQVLRAFKRHDPDLIWVGEVQDSYTAEICVSQASTGHLALSTMHANDTIQGFDHLAKMLPEDKRFQLVEACSAIISQRLVQKLCPHCCTVTEPTAEQRAEFERYCQMIGEQAHLPRTVAQANPEGCVFCDEQGYCGLLPINEVLLMTREAKQAASQLIRGAAGREVLEGHRAITMLQNLVARISRHEISMDSIFT